MIEPTSCAFVPCDQAASCSMVGGCVTARFGRQAPRLQPVSELRDDAPALNGTKPARFRFGR